MRVTIRFHVILACLAVILPLATVEVYFILDHYRSERREAVVDFRREAQGIAAAAAALMANLQNGAQVLAQEAGLLGGDAGRIQPLLERTVRATKAQAYVVFILPNGRVAASVPQEIADSGLNVADRPFFQALLAGGDWRPVNLMQSRVRGVPIWGVATTVRAGERFLGAIAVTVPAAEFERLIPVKMSAGSWSIVDGRGRLVYLNGVAEIPWERRDRSGHELVRRALSGEEAASEGFTGPDGVTRLGVSVPIRTFGWAVEVSQPVTEALAAATTQAWMEASKYGPILAIAILIAIFIGNRVSLPLRRLAVAVDRVTQGEPGAIAETGGPVEVARLATSFNTMSASLRRRQQWDEALKAIGRAATSGLSLNEILVTALQAMIQASGATVGLIRLVDPQTRNLVVAAHRNLPQEYLDVAREIPWGAKLAGYVAYTGEPWMVGRLQDQPQVSHLSLLAGQVQSLACLPLKTHEQVVGTITLGHHQPQFFGPAALPLLLPAASMLGGSVLAEQLRLATSREAEEKALLFRELDHRVRNNLAALIGLLYLGADEAEGTAAERLLEMAERVARLADVHNLLAGRGVQPVDVRELSEVVAKNVLAALPGGARIQWRVTGTPVRVPASQVTAIALILNELLTNCVKHAFPGRATGRVSIEVRRDGDQVVLGLRDDGVGLDRAKHPAGLGLSIVQTLVTQNLRGSVSFANPGGGTAIFIRFPQPEEGPAGGAP